LSFQPHAAASSGAGTASQSHPAKTREQGFLRSLDAQGVHHYHRVVARSVALRSHLQVLEWLQGDMQSFFPHTIMIAAWGDFERGEMQHDIVSGSDGMRIEQTDSKALAPMLSRYFLRWNDVRREPVTLSAGARGFLLDDSGTPGELGKALQNMRSAVVHGIRDTRGRYDCLYVAFTPNESFSPTDLEAMRLVLPYIDSALRQCEYMPGQSPGHHAADTDVTGDDPTDQTLSGREFEILEWIAMGKTNPEIGSILGISLFTVKNHVQRIFRKLNVSNRAQAVTKLPSYA
jgi:transcriptional regulator EpsA